MLFAVYDYIRSNKGVHAEIKIANRIYQSSQERKEYYIGISKLNCAPCHVTLGVLSQRSLASFRTCGTHGATYGSNWILPDKINREHGKEIFNMLESKLLYIKLKETMSEVQNKGLTESRFYAVKQEKEQQTGSSLQAQIQQINIPPFSPKP